jgi:hypothetical protein
MSGGPMSGGPMSGGPMSGGPMSGGPRGQSTLDMRAQTQNNLKSKPAKMPFPGMCEWKSTSFVSIKISFRFKIDAIFI